MSLSQVLSRLNAKGDVTIGTGTPDATKVVITGSDGKIDTSLVSGGDGGGGFPTAAQVSYNPAYSGSNMDAANNHDLDVSLVNAQVVMQELDTHTLRYNNALTDLVSPSIGFANIKVAATAVLTGVVQLATQTQVSNGTDNGSDTLVTGGTAKLVALPSILKNTYLNKLDGAGDTMTGPLVLPNASPNADNQAARKKYVDDQISAAISATTTLPLGHTLWVDKVNGNDGTALTGRLDKPFLTLTAAKAAAASGDTISVLPGTYNEKNLLKNGVNWYFYPGAIVAQSSAVYGAIWDDSVTYGTNGAVTCSIVGYGEFSNSSANGDPTAVINITNSGTNIQMECNKISNTTSNTAAVVLTNGQLRLKARSSISGTNTFAINATGGTHYIDCYSIPSGGIGAGGSSGYLYVKANTITTVLYSLIVNTSGMEIHVDADTITNSSSSFPCVLMTGDGVVGIKARKITSSYTYTVVVDNATTLKITDTEIINTKANTAAAGIGISDASTSAVITLKDCDITVNAAATSCIIDTATTATVTLHGYNRSNKPKDSSITFSHGVFETV